MLKRTFTIALLTTALAVGTNAAAAGVQMGTRGPYPPRPTPSPQPHPPKPHHHKPDRWIGPCQGWRLGENIVTPADWNDRSTIKIQRLVACVFTTLAPGNSGIALYVADRESSFYPWAKNPSSSASGVFQHLATYWPGRAAMLNRGWFGKGAWPASIWDPRASAMAAAIMVNASGWSAWSM